MKAFTVYQPYGFAIVAGLKCNETRPRRTHIRGRVAVHAGKRGISFDDYLIRAVELPAGAVLHYGAVLGTVEIADCVPVEEIAATLTERERLLGDYSPGRWAWILENPVMFDEPFHAKGQQGWWEWDEIEACKERIQKAAYQLGLNFFNGVTPGSSFPPADILRGQSVVFLRDLQSRKEIVIGPTTQDITLGNISLDVLPLLPGAVEGISDSGTYRVFQKGEFVGTVIYDGPPVQETPSAVNVGMKTTFRPAGKAERLYFEFELSGEEPK